MLSAPQLPLSAPAAWPPSRGEFGGAAEPAEGGYTTTRPPEPAIGDPLCARTEKDTVLGLHLPGVACDPLSCEGVGEREAPP